MTEEERGLLYATDKHVGVMAQSIEQLAVSVSATNSKLEDIFSVVNTQNVIMEKIGHIEENLKESFGRGWKRLEAVEKAQSEGGCSALKSQHTEIRTLGKSIDQLRDRIKEIEKVQKDSISSVTLRWSAYIIIGYTVVFGTYVVKTLHSLDKLTTERIHTQRGINKSSEARHKRAEKEISALREHTSSNYGHIKGLTSNAK